MHPTLLVAEEAEKRTRALVDDASGEAEGAVCDSFEQREFFVASCIVQPQKGPALEDESHHSKSECALYNLYLVAAVERTQWMKQKTAEKRREHVFMIKAWIVSLPLPQISCVLRVTLHVWLLTLFFMVLGMEECNL